jgi:hypothetical protein
MGKVSVFEEGILRDVTDIGVAATSKRVMPITASRPVRRQGRSGPHEPRLVTRLIATAIKPVPNR